jgi:DNA-directed RNA polymerase subunit RPC12/RpoP
MKIRSKFKLFLLLDIITFVLMLMGAGTWAILLTDDTFRGIVLPFMICTVVFFMLFIIPFSVFLWLAYKKMNRYDNIVAHFKFKGRENINEAARKLGHQPQELIDLLLKIKAEGMMEGFFDKGSGDFVWIDNTRVTLFSQPMKCSQCGATNTKRMLMGDTPVCEYCGSPLVAKDSARVCPFGHPLRKDEGTGKWMCDTCGRPY